MTGGLARERCEACNRTTAAVTESEWGALLAQLAPAWALASGHLHCTVPTGSFAEAFALATRIALLAEAEGHHPTLTVAWGRLEVDLVTHAIGGLSRNDFRLGAKIDAAHGWPARAPAAR
ncbi:MAG TPA: 4a-hydroxytetrahydrobiopterin dehydratase [Candidatus Micrarchaeia archaeon]|nr:4a-hydroxytetrahydrobiopterin dehydratase [Candidatus Micrarchaeia archaeon]